MTRAAWFLFAACAAACRTYPTPAMTLDSFHDAASRADEGKYFGLIAPDGVFLGTDASERWTKEEFRAYAHPHFEQGTGWTYEPRDRHIAYSPDGRIAWFDEMLDNESYGELRGTGALRKTADGWRIVQYNLAFTIPNDLARDVVKLIRSSRPATPGGG